MKLKFTDDRLNLFCAFRYALGRRTYVVSCVVDDIINNWNLLPEHDKNLFKKEIKEYEELYECLGMDCDKEQWYRILNKEN